MKALTFGTLIQLGSFVDDDDDGGGGGDDDEDKVRRSRS